MSKGAMIAVILAAVAVCSGVGFWWLNAKPAGPGPDYKPIMPPGGYGAQASGMAAKKYPGGSGPSYPGSPGGSNSPGGPSYPGSGGSYPGAGSR